MNLSARQPTPSMPCTQASRRTFLKLAGALTVSAAAQPAFPAEAAPLGLGRTTRGLNAFEEPAETARQAAFYPADTVLDLLEDTQAGDEALPNRTWFRVDKGWVYSGQVQPVRNKLNRVVTEIPERGFLAEVTVPFTDAWHNDADGNVHLAYRFYYSTTYWVDRLFTDRQGTAWYQVVDDRYDVNYFVLAEHLRRVPARELAPLSPKVVDKRIEVDLAQQVLTAYENGRAVLTARVATGRKGVETPKGNFRVERKRPSRHMAAGDAGGNGFDLPGVPWVSYFYWTGVALHGTYWHSDYGAPRSRGCVNLTPADAKWLYRWSLPVVPPEQSYGEGAGGTQVVVY